MSRAEAVVGYARVSRGAGSGRSIEAQRAAIGVECERRGWQLLRVETDQASGRESNRPGRTRALAACGAGEARALVVARLDRLARSLGEAARLLERAKREGWNLVALDLGLDLSTPHGERVANAFVSVAQWERRLISERTREALARTRAQGVKLGTPRTTPAPAVAKITKLRAQGLSLQAIADELNRLRVPTTRGGSRWRPSSVRSVLLRASRAP
jgi:DNA invertase Pin-like site-specific DNA recombinase